MKTHLIVVNSKCWVTAPTPPQASPAQPTLTLTLSPTPTHMRGQKDPPRRGPINVSALCSSLSGYMKCLWPQ